MEKPSPPKLRTYVRSSVAWNRYNNIVVFKLKIPLGADTDVCYPSITMVKPNVYWPKSLSSFVDVLYRTGWRSAFLS